MFGRLSRSDAPSCNQEGVPYRDLWLRERAIHAELNARYRAALESWLEAVGVEDGSRAAKIRKAKALTLFLLS